MITPVRTIRRAISSGDKKTLSTLFNKGLEADCRLQNGWTALHTAAKAGQCGIISLVLCHKGNINAETEIRQTPLDIAETFQQLEAAKLLTANGGKKGTELSLHGAVVAGDIIWVKKHLAAGADLNAKNRGELPLCLALRHRHWDVAELLMQQNADVSSAQNDGNAALHVAICSGADEHMLKRILRLGADLNQVGACGKTPLSWAASKGSELAVSFLLKNGADPKRVNKDRTTPISEALSIGHQHEEVARLLIDHGAKARLHEAVQCDHVTMVRHLLNKGANVEDKESEWSDTRLHLAVEHDSIKMVKLLLEFGANPNVQTRVYKSETWGLLGGNTPLHEAVSKRSAKMVKLLLSHGAEPDMQNAEGVSVLEMANCSRQTHLVRMMESHLDRQLTSTAVEQLYTVQKVAELLCVDEAFVEKLIDERKILHLKLNPNAVRIPAGSITRYISSLRK